MLGTRLSPRALREGRGKRMGLGECEHGDWGRAVWRVVTLLRTGLGEAGLAAGMGEWEQPRMGGPVLN